MLSKFSKPIQIDCTQIHPPITQPLAAVYRAYLDIFFDVESEEQLKVCSSNLALHLPNVYVRKIHANYYELTAGYRLFDLAQSLEMESVTTVLVDEMTNESVFQFAVTSCVLSVLAFDTNQTKTTNKQLREFYLSLKSGLDPAFVDLLKTPYLVELLKIPRSHLRKSVPSAQSALELQREQVQNTISKEDLPKYVMSKFSLAKSPIMRKTPETGSDNWMENDWIDCFSKEQKDQLKHWLRKSSQLLTSSSGAPYAK